MFLLLILVECIYDENCSCIVPFLHV
uniref:Uncharacterized protein n=1 Tax=Arundo donax TaxID=35708 RepID=A0A0A8ZYT0_ARUDO